MKEQQEIRQVANYNRFLKSKRAIFQYQGRDIQPGAVHSKLFSFQRDLTTWACRRGRCAIFADCVAGETLITGPDGSESIETLSRSGKPIQVFSLNYEGKLTAALATMPFAKGIGSLFEVKLASGKTVIATSRHRFLTIRGWIFVSSLQIGECLLSSDVCHLQSNVEPVPSGLLLNDPRFVETLGDCLADYFADYGQYDLRPHSAIGIDQAPAPLQADVPEHDLLYRQKDDWEHRSKHNHHHQDSGHLSMLDCSGQDRNAVDDGLSLPLSCASRLHPCNSQNVSQSYPCASRLQSCGEFPQQGESLYGDDQSSAYITFDTVVSISYLRTDVYYDLHVPLYENYLANGVWSHNTGLGKTYMQIEWARLMGEKTLVVAPLSVARQTVREGIAINVGIDYVRDQSEVKEQISITNYEMLDHFDGSEFGAVVLDECFPPDTLVDTIQNGIMCKKHIRDIRPNEIIANTTGRDRVVETHRRKVGRAVKITYRGNSITSSENHPFFTQRGWIGAVDLAPGDYLMETAEALRLVSSGICTKIGQALECAVLRDILLSEMADEANSNLKISSQPGSSGETGESEVKMATFGRSESQEGNAENTNIESDEQSDSTREGESDIASDEARTFRTWWQRTGDDGPSINLTEHSIKRMGSGVRLITGEAKSGLSIALQARFSKSRKETLHRGGWYEPLQPKGNRRKERCNVGFARVEGIEILEQGHPELEQWRSADGFIYFYDIKAARHPSFSVDGLLVHNSSILKGLSGVIKNKLIEMFSEAKYKLCCTATPAPNDLAEIANHAEFLGVMSRTDIMSTFFVHDDEGWRLRGHAKTAFFRWLSSWGMFLRLPSDLGYSDEGYILPPLNIEKIQVQSLYVPEGQLFAVNIGGIGTRSKVRRGVIEEKIESAVELCGSNNEQWIIWCGLNDESSRLAKAIEGAVNIQGSDSIERKREGLENFQDGKLRVLVTKGKIGGFGINLQNCHNQIFFGLSDSWEQYYQCVRRSYRFGQDKEVNVYILIASAEEDILRNVLRKDAAAESLRKEMIESIKGFELLEIHKQEAALEYKQETVHNDNYKLMLGDSCERVKEIESDSVGMSIFSPPFLSLYAYSPTERDLGNSRSEQEFFDHFSFLIDELLRITRPGRNCCVHVSQVPAMLVRDGYIGLKDFRGKTIDNFEKHGFIYHGEVCIDKNPQAQAIRTHSKALLFAQLKRDSSWLRPALLDYVLVFRKPGDNAEPITPELSNDTWIKWAHGVWYDIDETNTLNYREAREHADDRHICPLQLETIERAMMLWSNKGDLVFSPFMGIGSEGYVAIKNNRRFVGIELKKSYFDTAVKNINQAASERDSGTLFANNRL